MPIRFRCAYCNQLMGISHRKAGTVVKCPKCAGDIIVPVPEGTAPSPGPDAFDDANFDPRAEDPVDGSAGMTAAVDEPSGLAPVRPAPAPPRRFGIFLSIGTLLISMLVIVLLLVLMFVLGLIIGKQSVTPGP